jgi:hypothetical protein
MILSTPFGGACKKSLKEVFCHPRLRGRDGVETLYKRIIFYTNQGGYRGNSVEIL